MMAKITAQRNPFGKTRESRLNFLLSMGRLNPRDSVISNRNVDDRHVLIPI